MRQTILTRDPQRRARAIWHRQQYKWHSRRLKSVRHSWLFYPTGDAARADAAWHKSQMAWHEDRFIAWAYPLSEVVAETFRKHAPALAANVTRNNALLTRLKGRQ